MRHVPGNDAIVQGPALRPATVVSHIARKNAIGDERISGFTEHPTTFLKPAPVAGAVSQSESVERREIRQIDASNGVEPINHSHDRTIAAAQIQRLGHRHPIGPRIGRTDPFAAEVNAISHYNFITSQATSTASWMFVAAVLQLT